MSEVLVPLPDGRWLALEPEQLDAALARGQALMTDSRTHEGEPGQVLDARGMEAATGVPATWWMEAARRGDVPTIRAGKYVRFNFREVVGALGSKRERRN